MLRTAGSIALASLLIGSSAFDAGKIQAQPIETAPPGERRLVELYQKYRDTVVKVKIATRTVDESGQEKVALTVLSGFYIDDKGTVLTNAIPMQEGPRLRIEKDGAQFLAVAVASDPRSNIGLVQVAKPPSNLSYINIETNVSPPSIGSLAYAITSPLDFSATPKLGLVSGRESSFSDIVFPFTYTRVSIPSGPAEGGSPVFDSSGSLIGVSVASLPDIDSSYLVPTKALRRIIEGIRQTDGDIHPIVKARFSEKVDPTTLERIVAVDSVENEGAANRSGLRQGDRILSVDGEPIESIDEWRDTIFFKGAGSFASLIVGRGNEQKEIALLLESE